MKKFLILIVIFTNCPFYFSNFIYGQEHKSSNPFSIEITPHGKYIYKVPEVLGRENWMIFLNIRNNSHKSILLEKIIFYSFSYDKEISSISRFMDAKIAPDSSYKIPMIFFREYENLNVNNMKVKIITNMGTKIIDKPLARYKQPVKVSFPLRGVWQVTSAHEFGITHRRWDNRAQFAYDFVKIDGTGNLYKGNPKNQQDYYAFGQPVFAPAECTVLKVHDGEPDNSIGNIAKHANCVYLDLGNGIICVMAHFRNHSIIVKEGQKLKEGERIAEVGNSGMSDNPHLHIHFQEYDKNSKDPFNPGLPLPFSFSNYYVHPSYLNTWEFVKQGSPHSGDFIKYK